uniref:LEM domain-containing protein n=1 Tax=Anopheles minimus TaxID=112268 RepID=A0A182WB77_9DIPT
MSERRPAVYDILEELSNEEIRRRIVFYGGPNLPVTDQTRGRLLDVLREYIDQSKQHRRPKESNVVPVLEH